MAPAPPVGGGRGYAGACSPPCFRTELSWASSCGTEIGTEIGRGSPMSFRSSNPTSRSGSAPSSPTPPASPLAGGTSLMNADHPAISAISLGDLGPTISHDLGPMISFDEHCGIAPYTIDADFLRALVGPEERPWPMLGLC